MSYLLAGFSGVLLILIFPFGNVDLLAWAALIPLMRAIEGVSPRRAALIGLCAGFVAYAGIMYWIMPLVRFNTGSVLQSVVCLSALSAYLALYLSIWAGALAFIRPPNRLLYALCAAAVWVALEYARTYVLTGLPWALIGYSQYRVGWLLPSAAYAGVYGISFLVVAGNALLYRFLFPRTAIKWLVAGIVLAGTIVTLRATVPIPADEAHSSVPPVLIAVAQPCIEQYKKWDEQFRAEMLATYDAMADTIAAWAPKIIVWPETVVPGFLPVDESALNWVESLVRRTGVINVIGTPYSSPDGISYNGSVVFSGSATAIGVHRKTHLVPFGEFVPLRSMLEPFFGVLNMLGDFQRGKELLPVDAGELRLGINICSENLFGSCARELTRNGATVLVNQTNDAWFFDTAAPEQHFIMNVFRAVENNRPVVVSGNTGVSGIISPRGCIVRRTAVFERTWFAALVSPETGTTFYTRRGDVFAVSMCVIAMLLLLGRILCLINCRKS